MLPSLIGTNSFFSLKENYIFLTSGGIRAFYLFELFSVVSIFLSRSKKRDKDFT
jgi:hypothetical protein